MCTQDDDDGLLRNHLHESQPKHKMLYTIFLQVLN